MHFAVTGNPKPLLTSPDITSSEQQERYAALVKEQDSERMMDDGFFRSGAGNPDSSAGS